MDGKILKRAGLTLLLVMTAAVLSAGCGQKAAETPKNASAGTEAAEQLAWPEREAYDKAFDKSLLATMTLSAQTCSCGAEGISCVQSYTDTSAGAQAVRDCPSGQSAAQDNLFKEEYADSFYCSACGKQEVTLTTEEIWVGCSQMKMPHYHLAEAEAASWCSIYTDTQGDKWAYFYEGPQGTDPIERVRIEQGTSAMERISSIFADQLQDA